MTKISARISSTIVAGALALAMSLGFVSAQGAQSAYADEYPTSQEITVALDGDVDSAVTFTADELKEADLLSSQVTGYLYRMPGATTTWYVVGATNSINLKDLFGLADLGSYWTSGASLELIATDGPFTRYTLTYDELENNANQFYPNTTNAAPSLVGAEKTPSVLAFTYCQQEIPAGMTAKQVLDSDSTKWIDSTRICVGLTESALDATDGTNMGRRMPYDLTDITIVPAA